MAAVLKVFAAVFAVVVAVGGVSAQTHHVVGDDNGWGPDLNVSAWLLGRVFSVGDKIWFKYSGAEDNIVELKGLEEFASCDVTNPIKMYTDPVSHVVLEKEGVRYFASGNPESCKNGLKLPVPVLPVPEYYDPPFAEHPPPPYEPYTPAPVKPTPTPPYQPPVPVRPPPPPPPTPSAAARLNGLSFVLSVVLLICYVGI